MSGRDAHVCAVCRTVLDWWSPFDGSPGRWRHTQANTPADGHAVVPVPRREMTEVRTRCDYCSRPDPVYIFVLSERLRMLALDGDVPMFGATDDDGMWSACADCAAAVETGSPVKLTSHVARILEAEGVPVSREILYQMYVSHLAVPRLRVEITEESK